MNPVSLMTSRISVNGTRGNEFQRLEPSPHFTFRFAGRREAARASVAASNAKDWRRVIVRKYTRTSPAGCGIAMEYAIVKDLWAVSPNTFRRERPVPGGGVPPSLPI